MVKLAIFVTKLKMTLKTILLSSSYVVTLENQQKSACNRNQKPLTYQHVAEALRLQNGYSLVTRLKRLIFNHKELT